MTAHSRPRGALRRFVPALAACIGLTTGCALQPNDNTLPGQTAVGSDGYTVRVHFDHIENLVPNSTVQKDNVVVGTVASIDVRGWEAVVELRLLRDEPIPADAVFSIGQKTLLGAQYVDVVSPAPTGASRAVGKGRSTTRMLRHGDVVPAEQTGTYPATEQVLGAVALLLNDGGLSQISTITGELSTALEGRVPDTRSLVRHADELLSVLDANRTQIVTALESLEKLSAGLRVDQDELATAIERITPGLRVLEEERGRLVAAVARTGRTSNQAVRLVRASENALLANLDALGPILTNLGRASESLPEALKIGLTIPFPAMTTRKAVKGDYANLFATLDLRSAGLAEIWLGGLPPALQAGDPVQGPLTTPDGPREEPKVPRDPAGAVTDQLGELIGPSGEGTANPGTGDPGTGSDAKRPCLLNLLGDC